LLKTIQYFNSNILKPFEILICIPNDLLFKIENITFDNVKIVKTNKSGQVYQRLCGFKEASQNFVLQLDDDIQISIHDIEILYLELLKLPPNSAIGPQYFNIKTNDYSYKNLTGLKMMESYFIEFIFGGAKFGSKRMGTISTSGKNFEFDITYMKSNTVEVSWLAGGCVLHHKINLNLNNYYPFSGKAYCEDLIHSILLKKNNINLFLTKLIVCNLEDNIPPSNYLEILQEKIARQYVIFLLNGSINRYRLTKIYWGLKYRLINFF
jgi:hypothetical protein